MKDFTTLILPDVREILASGDDAELRQALGHLHPADVADLVVSVSDPDRVRLFECLEPSARTATFEHLEEDDQLELVGLLGRQRMVGILDAMSSDDRADFIKSLPAATVDALLPLLAQAERNDVRRLVAYPEETAGALMTTEYAALTEDTTVSGALERLRQVAPERETIYYVYVVSAERTLRGVVTLTELVRARPGRTLAEVMNRDVIAIPVETDQEEVARMFERYDFLAMPVVDAAGKLLGIVTHDDVLDVVQEESTEDAHRMGAIEPLDDPYLRSSFWALAWRRGLWLSILFLGGMITTVAFRKYEDAVSQVMGLVFFVPLIISSGGNTGSQSATLITRALALGEVSLRDWFRVFRRELATGFLLGSFLGSVGFVRAVMWGTGPTMAVVVGGAILAVVTFGSLLGALFPLLLQRVGLDPAVSSTPFVASMVDVVGIVVYFSIAQALLLG
ncbi:MAG: magnesium transporter [Acidobacteriota bacterium]|jgi:magnesium transporter